MIAAALSGAPAFAASGVPDWVKQAAAQKLPEYPSSTKAVMLLSETTYTVGTDGRAVEHVREVVKILRPQGRKYGYPVVWYDKDSKVLSFKVWSIDQAGHEYTVKDSEISDYSPPGEGGQLYSDERAKVADPPGRDPGGVIAYEYDLRERPYLAEANWRFQSDIPRVQQKFKLVLPPTYTYTTTWAHHPKVDAADLENHSYVWERNNESAVDLEGVSMRPAENALTARMTIHYAGPGMAVPQEGTWKGIGDWYDTLDHDRFAPSPEITAKAAELTAGKTDFYDKAEAIAVFMQQHIRYWVIEMGVGGYQPHPAADTFKGGYGDCKDKATLLSSMLSTVGIHSALLMVDTERGVIDPEAPSIWGNHMIAAIEIPKGYESPKMHSVVTAKTGKRYLIFDPTWTETSFGQVERNLQDSYALLLENGHGEVIHIPVMDPGLNTVKRTGTFTLAADGTLKGSVTEKRYGDVSDRRRMMAKQADAKEQQEAMDRIVGNDLSSVSLTKLKFVDANTLAKDVVTTFDLEAAHFASATGPLLMLRPRVYGSDSLSVDRKQRKVPFDLRETMQAHDEFDIGLPPGYAVDELPEAVKKDWGFAAYESKTTVDGNTLHFARTYTVREITLPASKHHDLEEVARVIGADEGGQVILKRLPGAAVAAK